MTRTVKLRTATAVAGTLITVASVGCRPRARSQETPAEARPAIVAEADSGMIREEDFDPFAPAAELETTPESPFHVVAVGRFAGGLHLLASGDVLYDHDLTIRRLAADETLTPFLTADPGPDFATESSPIGAVAGASLDDLWFSMTEGDHRAGYTSRLFHLRAGQTPRVARVPEAGSWFYLDVRDGPEARLLALRATGAVEFDPSSYPYGVDRIDVLRGAPMKLPEWEEHDYHPAGWAAFASGEIVLAGGRGTFMASVPAVLRATPQDPAGSYSSLPGATGADTVTAVAALRPDAIYVAGTHSGENARSARLWKWDGRAWSVEVVPDDMRGIASLVIAPDGTLWALEEWTDGGGVWRRHPGGAFTAVPLGSLRDARFAAPAPRLSYRSSEGIFVDRRATLADPENRVRATDPTVHDATPLVAHSIVTRGDDDTWIVATGQDEGAYLLHSRTDRRAVIDVDLVDGAAEIAAENETPAPLAGPTCESIFVSLGAPTDEAIARFQAQKPPGAGPYMREAPVVRGTVHGTPVFGSFFGAYGRASAESFARRWRGLGWTVTEYCRRPVLEGLVE